MSTYRVYCIEGADQISLADWIEAEGDEEAISHARTLCGKGRVEIWQKNRLIAKIHAKGVERVP